jgi:hypothetical protein
VLAESGLEFLPERRIALRDPQHGLEEDPVPRPVELAEAAASGDPEPLLAVQFFVAQIAALLEEARGAS